MYAKLYLFDTCFRVLIFLVHLLASVIAIKCTWLDTSFRQHCLSAFNSDPGLPFIAVTKDVCAVMYCDSSDNLVIPSMYARGRLLMVVLMSYTSSSVPTRLSCNRASATLSAPCFNRITICWNMSWGRMIT